MTAVQATIAKWVIIVLVLFFAGYGVRDYMANHEKTEFQLSQEKQLTAGLKDYVTKIEERDAQIGQLQEQLHQLDVTHTKALDEKLAENSRLRGDLAVAKRMRFTGASCPQGPAVTGPTEAGSLGDGAGVELSAEGRQDVFDLRGNIQRNEAALTYLQGYTTELTDWIGRQRWCGAK